MNRILFLLNKKNNDSGVDAVCRELNEAGIETRVISVTDWLSVQDTESTDELIVTDSKEVLSLVKSRGEDALIIVNRMEELDNYKDGKYFVMDIADCEVQYFDRVYRRINRLPWTMYETERLIVRETTEADVPAFYRIYDDPLIKKFTDPLYEDIEDELKYTREYIDSVYSVQGFGIWTLVDRDTGKIVGRGGLIHRSGFDEIEVGFLIASEFRGKGYGLEAVSSFVSFARKEGYGDINALVRPGNVASTGLLNKVGFEYVKNEFVDGTEYEIFCCRA